MLEFLEVDNLDFPNIEKDEKRLKKKYMRKNLDFPDIEKEEIRIEKKYKRVFDLTNSCYDFTKSVAEQGYTGEFIQKNFNGLKKDALKLLSKNVVFLCSRKEDQNMTLEIFKGIVNRSLGVLLRLASVLIIEDPEKRSTVIDLMREEKYMEEMDNTAYPRNNFYFFRDKYNNTTDFLPSIWELYLKRTENYDRILGENMDYTRELIKTYSLSKPEGVQEDEVIPLHIREFVDDMVFKEYARKAGDTNLLLDIQNHLDLYMMMGGVKERFNLDNFLSDIPGILDFVFSKENIGKISPRLIKFALTLLYED